MAKRADREGHIRQRKDGRWEGQYTYEDELGQPKRGSVYGKTQADVRRALRELEKQVEEGTYKKPRNYTVAEWLDEWLTTYCHDLKPSTYAGYKSKIETRIKPYLGKVYLKSLTNIKLQKYFNQLSDGGKGFKPLSPKSVQNIHGIIHKALEQAIVCELIEKNPADRIKLPKVVKADLKPLMDDSIAAFLNQIHGDPYERVLLIDLFSGLRQSEIIGLQWEDIDFQNGTIHVCRQIQRDYLNGGGQYLFLDYTKSNNDRMVAVPPAVLDVLREQQAEQQRLIRETEGAWKPERNLVFTDMFGHHLKHRTVYNHFKAAVRAIGADETRFHDLRHSFAINCLQAGIDVKTVQSMMGHYSAAFTMDTYAAVSNTMQKSAQDKMQKFFNSVQENR